jgi:hypothetical protein
VRHFGRATLVAPQLEHGLLDWEQLAEALDQLAHR